MPILLPDTRSPRCSSHPKVASGWRCSVCRKWLCEACAVEKVVPPTRFEACGHCGERADEVRVRRVRPAWPALVRDVFRYPLTDHAKPYLMTLVVLLVLGLCWWPGRLAGVVVLAGVLFECVRASGRGEKVVPGHFELAGFFGMVREATAAALPFLLWAGVVAIASLVVGPTGVVRSVVLASAITLGALWASTAFIFVSVGTSLAGVLNPASAWGLWWKAGAALLPTTVLFAVTSLSWLGLQLLGDALVDRWQVWILPHLMLEPLRVYVAMAGARAVGWQLFVHGGDAGYGTQAEWYDPALGAVRPTRAIEVKVEAEEEGPPRVVEPIELDDTPLVPRTFETFQPTDPGASIELPEGVEEPSTRTVDDGSIRPEAFAAVTATRAATVPPTEDLMDEEEFLRSVGAVPEAGAGRKAE